jgi:hypothetical protein
MGDAALVMMATPDTMVCSHCREAKPIVEFSPSYVKRGRGTCRDCLKASAPRSSERRAKWHVVNKGRLNAQARERYARDPDKARADARAVYARRKARHGAAWAEEVHRGLLRSKFKITPEEYAEMLSAQGGACACCGGVNENGMRLAVDHDHSTGMIRGLLCGTCNTGIGALGDGADGVRRALAYLERSRA